MIRCIALLWLLLFGLAGSVFAEAPPDRVAQLSRGINLTNWFRFPPAADAASLRSYLSDAAIAQLHQIGFTSVRLPVQPELLLADPARLPLLAEAIDRLQRHGLAVVVVAHPAAWQLETSEADRVALLAFWTRLAPALRRFSPGLTFPELLNEPVFPGNPEAWQRLQHDLLLRVRAMLPDNTLVLTGNDWGSVGGLLALRPEADANVIYSFHDYDPAELTALAAYRPGLDRGTLAALPFPADDRAACFRVAESSGDPATAALIRFYCGLHWNAARIGQRFAAAAAWGRRNHASLLLGEFGATAALNRPARLHWLEAVRRQAEAQHIGWMLWGYEDVMGFAVARPPPRRPALDAGMLRALGLADAP